MNNINGYALYAALKELSELKYIKELIESDNFSHVGDYNFYKSEYEKRKPIAWQKAKELVEKYKLLFE